ncbi:MAG: ketopantoate reductase family protein [Planctomycetes bacterium]|nr:ketopantoate reductase family protein [Planctomycetota bacterium]
MPDTIYIIGAGAIGSLVGSFLTRKFGKEKVVLVDVDEEHIDAAQKNGLKVFDKGTKSPRLETVDINITSAEKIDKAKLENVILATKSYSNDEALKGLKKDIPLLVLQNGYDERLNEFPNAVRGVEFGFACQIKEPGYVFNAVKGKYVMGTSAGLTTHVADWAAMFNESDIKADMKENIDGYMWSKLLINSALNPVSAIKKCSFKELIETDESRELFKALYVESYPVVKRKADELNQKLGSFIGPPDIANWIFKKPSVSDFLLKMIAGKFGEVESSMLQDVRKNRPTEIDFINGAIVRLGKEYGIETPKNEWICKEITNYELRITN